MMSNQPHTDLINGVSQDTNVIRLFLTDAGRLIAIDESFYNRVKTKVMAALPGLNRGSAYKAEYLYGKDDWPTLPSGERKRFGICVSLMVKHGHLPLSRADSAHEYPCFYRLK